VEAGEYVYGISPFRHLLEHRSIDIVMIDLLRAGGITHGMKIAGMAEAFNLPVVSRPDRGPVEAASASPSTRPRSRSTRWDRRTPRPFRERFRSSAPGS
jgi:L-alanine-DL-glutamate epimerase-like enolase superfamily enzyme